MNNLVTEQIEHFRERIPYTTGCSDTRNLKHILHRDEAINYPFIQMNFPQQHYLTFETTQGHPMRDIILQDLPPPAIIATDRVLWDSSLMYELIEPLPLKPSTKTRRLLRDVKTAYKSMLKARRVVGINKLIRNPLSNTFDIITPGQPVSLLELAESIPATAERRPLYKVDQGSESFEATVDADSRNCSLFEAARRFAYRIVGQMGTEDEFYQAIENEIVRLNDEEIPKYFDMKIQNTSELRCTARSISRWTWKRRSQFRSVNVGAMGLPTLKGAYRPNDEWERIVKRYRQKSAERTHGIVKSKKSEKIREAVQACLEDGIKTNPTNIARLAGVSRPTVYAHKDVVNEVLNEKV